MLSQDRVRAFQQRWRETYAMRFQVETGRWVYRGFDWHVFSFDFCRSVRGHKAIDRALDHLTADALVFSDAGESSEWGVKALVTKIDVLAGIDSALDVIVAPEDLSWTLVFSHGGSGGGPFFSDRSLLQ